MLITLALALTTLHAADLDPLRTFEVRLPILTNAAERTVYVFDNDRDGVPSCYDKCAVAWPPVLTERASLPAPLSIVVRRDGARQIAYAGRPLYTFFRDERAGDLNGDGLHGVWHLVRP